MKIERDGDKVEIVDGPAHIVLSVENTKRLVAALQAVLPFEYQSLECSFCDNGAFKSSTVSGARWCCSGCGRRMEVRNSLGKKV